MTKKYEINMTEGALLPKIVLFAVPLMLSSILQLLYNAADVIVVGRFAGSSALAAVSSTGSLINLIVNLFIGLSVGTGVTVAHAIGSREDTAVHRAVHTAMPTALIGGAILTVVGILLSEPLLKMMDTPETVLPLSTIYMQIYFGGMIFNMVYNFCASILRAAGDTKSPLIYLTLAGVINVVLNFFFVTAFHMNVAGVALATTISQGVSAVLVVIALMRRTDACHLDLKKMRIYKPQFMKMVAIGIPAGIQGSLFSISNVLIQSSINSFGDVFMSGNAAAGNIEGFAYVSINAFSQTAVNYVGQNVGARQYKRVGRIVAICLACVVVVGLTIGIAAYSFGETLLSIYITDSPEAIAYGMVRLACICLPYFLCGMMDVSTGALRGMGASIAPMVISILGVCGLRILWIYTIFQIPQFHTPQCLYFSYTISWSITFLIQITTFLRKYRKQLRLMPQSA